MFLIQFSQSQFVPMHKTLFRLMSDFDIDIDIQHPNMATFGLKKNVFNIVE